MSNALDDGGPAFPEAPADHNGYTGRPGMSLRDYFAAKVLGSVSELDARYLDATAKLCYDMADALLRARKPPATSTVAGSDAPLDFDGYLNWHASRRG